MNADAVAPRVPADASGIIDSFDAMSATRRQVDLSGEDGRASRVFEARRFGLTRKSWTTR
jgi:hypothetical protein